jgi:hypothetical protein
VSNALSQVVDPILYYGMVPAYLKILLLSPGWIVSSFWARLLSIMTGIICFKEGLMS